LLLLILGSLMLVIIAAILPPQIGQTPRAARTTPTPPKPVATGQAENPAIDSDKELSKIVVTFRWNDNWKEGRKQLVVAYQNNSQYEFNGAIYVVGKSRRDEIIGRDWIPLTYGIAPDGSRGQAILWFENADVISNLSCLSGERA
jgi:hypothetical protein